MKIAFFGNTNNGALMLSRAMQGMGHDVLLIVNRKELLHRPESQEPEYRERYPEWIVDGSQFSEWDYISLNPHIAPILEALSGYEALILNDVGHSFLPFLQLPAISLLTGSDLYYYADFNSIEIVCKGSEEYKNTLEAKKHEQFFRDFIKRQREGICLAVAVHYMPRGIEPQGDAILSELGIQDSKRFFQFIAELEKIKPLPQSNNTPIRVFCPVRITWKHPIEPGRSVLDYKGSDIMIRGLSLFHKKTGTSLDIRLVRKGLHITALEQLIKEENIDDQVTWLEEMPVTAVWKEMARSDIILEQFGSSMVARVGMDAMASGRPVIGNLRPEILGDSIPICQARTPEEICAQLERLVFNPQERERVGKASRKYVEEHASVDEFARKCIKYLELSITNQHNTKLFPHSTLSYCLQQRYLLYEEKITQGYIIQQTSAREAELLEYLNVYASSGEKALKRITLKKLFHHEIGLCWTITLMDLKNIADNGEDPNHSTLLLYEDDKLLQPAHANHENICILGGGRYSHWNKKLYFSTSDGSDPNTNRCIYRAVYVSSNKAIIN